RPVVAGGNQLVGQLLDDWGRVGPGEATLASNGDWQRRAAGGQVRVPRPRVVQPAGHPANARRPRHLLPNEFGLGRTVRSHRDPDAAVEGWIVPHQRAVLSVPADRALDVEAADLLRHVLSLEQRHLEIGVAEAAPAAPPRGALEDTCTAREFVQPAVT